MKPVAMMNSWNYANIEYNSIRFPVGFGNDEGIESREKNSPCTQQQSEMITK